MPTDIKFYEMSPDEKSFSELQNIKVNNRGFVRNNSFSVGYQIPIHCDSEEEDEKTQTECSEYQINQNSYQLEEKEGIQSNQTPSSETLKVIMQKIVLDQSKLPKLTNSQRDTKMDFIKMISRI